MTALYSVATPAEGINGQAFAVVADDTTAHYVFPDGSDSWEGLDDKRIANVAALSATPPTDAESWLSLALANVGYVTTSDPIEAADIDAARIAALQAVEVAAPGDETTAAPYAPPQTRDELLAFQRTAMDEWARLYPEAAAGDVDDPEADLALVQLLTPPVDPTKPHKWLPIATTETDCGFCEQPADAAIHDVTADTITRGSN